MPMMVMATQKASAPSVPTGLIADAQSTTVIDLTWSASVNVSGSVLAGYKVYRNGALIGTSVARTFSDTGLTENTAYTYQVASYVAAGHTSQRSTAVIESTLGSNSAPVWDGVDGTPLAITSGIVGAAYDEDMDDDCTDADGDVIAYSVSGTQDSPPPTYTAGMPPGLSLVAGHIVGTCTTAGNYSISIDADDQFVDVTDDETEWTEDKAAAQATSAYVTENFAAYANRGAMLNFYEALDASTPLPQNGVQNTFYPGYSSGAKYDDPPPGGATAKLDLDFTTFLTGSKALKCLILAAEGGGDAGAVLEMPVNGTPPTEYYFRMIWRSTHASLFSHDYSGSNRKLGWLNHFGPGNGQIVPCLYQDLGPWVSAFRYDGGGARVFDLDHGSTIGGRRRQILGGWDTDPGGSTPGNASQWDARWGPSANAGGNIDQTDPNFAAIHRPTAVEWFVSLWYINLSYVGTTSHGMIKSWGAPKGTAPQLQMLHVDDCAFITSAAPESVRVTFRPEDSVSGNSDSAGIIIDSVLLQSGPVAPLFPGRFVVPHQGTTIPAGFPIAGTSDD